jgi:ribose-phosphate pyrophosphokinase
MSDSIIFGLPGNDALAASLCSALQGRPGQLEQRHFPDDESYLRVASDVYGTSAVLVCALDRPDTKLLPLAFAADTLRDLGVRRVGLVAPYLAYMRQDRRFHPGEAVTSRTFAKLLSQHVDWLVTVDPHLHRYHALTEIYTIPAEVVHAAAPMAKWIREHITRPLLIGPDRESAQWVSEVATAAGADYVVCDKERRGDREVSIVMPDLSNYMDRQAVLIDDVASSGRTLSVAAGQLQAMGFAKPDCLVVHPLFAGDSFEVLSQATRQIASTNTINHESNQIDIAEAIGQKVRSLL